VGFQEPQKVEFFQKIAAQRSKESKAHRKINLEPSSIFKKYSNYWKEKGCGQQTGEQGKNIPEGIRE